MHVEQAGYHMVDQSAVPVHDDIVVMQPDAPKNPRAVAEAIVAALPSTEYLADTPTLAGPGFINAKLSSQWLGTRIQNMLRNGIATWAPRLNRKHVVIDFSSPNVAKEMHVGHLRSTIIGDTLARTLEFCGADVLRLNHVVCMQATCPYLLCMSGFFTMVCISHLLCRGSCSQVLSSCWSGKVLTLSHSETLYSLHTMLAAKHILHAWLASVNSSKNWHAAC